MIDEIKNENPDDLNNILYKLTRISDLCWANNYNDVYALLEEIDRLARDAKELIARRL